MLTSRGFTCNCSQLEKETKEVSEDGKERKKPRAVKRGQKVEERRRERKIEGNVAVGRGAGY
jgi:hypothetical protein